MGGSKSEQTEPFLISDPPLFRGNPSFSRWRTQIGAFLQTGVGRVLAISALLALSLLWRHAAGSTSGSVCPYDGVFEIKMSSIWGARSILKPFFDSYKMNMLCFPPFHLSVPDHEVELFEQFVAQENLTNVRVRPERLPEGDWAWIRGRSQYSEFLADKYVQAPFVLYLDTDLMLTMPLSCSAIFDELGKPLVRSWPWWPQWSTNHEVLRLARERRPDKWTWTAEEELQIHDESYMSYFPIIVPRHIIGLVREIFEDAYDQPWEQSLMQKEDWSQFDLFRRVTKLLEPEAMRWIDVQKSAVAFAPDAKHADTEANFYMDPLLHVPFSHAYDLIDELPPGIQDGDEGYMNRARIVAKHSLCMRQAHWPDLNDIDTDQLHRDLLPEEADRLCDANEEMIPETIMTHMASFTGFWTDERVPRGKTDWIKSSLEDGRVKCSKPASSGSVSQSWWTPT